MFWLLSFFLSYVWFSVNDLGKVSAQCMSQSPESLVYASYSQLGGCPVNYVGQIDSISNASSLLDCARLCTSSATCQGFSHLPDDRAKEFDFNCAWSERKISVCSELTYLPKGMYYEKTSPSCAQPWKPILSQQRGQVTSGSVGSLIGAIQQGSRIRVLIEGSNSDEGSLMLVNVDSAWVVNETVTAEMFAFVPPSDYVYGAPVWARIRANSSGMVNYIEYDHGSYDFVVNMTWFEKYKEPMCNGNSSTLLKMNSNEEILEGSIDNVIDAVKEGFPIQMVEKREGNALRSFPILTAHIPDPSTFHLYGVWMSESFQSSSLTSEMRLFQNLPRFTYVSFPNLDLMNSSAESSFQYNDEEITLVGDFCWEKVYAHDGTGSPTFGSFPALVDHILKGSDIRVLYQCDGSSDQTTLTLNRLVVALEYISGHAANDFDLPIGQPFNWRRQEVYTNGTVNSITLDRSDGTETLNSCQAQIFWFADKILRTASWYYDEALNLNSADYTNYPENHLYRGEMPRVSVTKSTQDLQTHYSLQTLMYKPLTKEARGFNYRSFNGSSLAVIEFDSAHFVGQYPVNVDVDPGSSYGFYVPASSIFWFM